MDGVPFMISEKFACAPEGMQPVDLLGITIKTLAEIEKEDGTAVPGAVLRELGYEEVVRCRCKQHVPSLHG
ncbi:hypothetical protein EK904_004895 [Melospiza melodia maxima]|nr:hypothetical protein EK904_004895 [Melospiza melodia maxima]